MNNWLLIDTLFYIKFNSKLEQLNIELEQICLKYLKIRYIKYQKKGKFLIKLTSFFI